MGRGYVFGLLAGALFSSVSVGALSLMWPPVAVPLPPEMPGAAEAPAPEAPVPATTPETAAPAATDAATAPEPVESAEAPETEPSAEAVKTPEAEAPAAPTAQAPTSEPEPSEAAPAVETEMAAPETAPVATETAAPAETTASAPAPETVAPAADNAAPAPAETAASEPAPVEAPTPDSATAGVVAEEPASETAPAPDQVAAAPLPEAPVVDVPAGSEFNRPKPEVDPVVPAPQPAPSAASAPTVSEPSAEAGPELTERTPAAVPEGQAVAPAALPEPAPAAPDAMAEAPTGETAVPVPPPGLAMTPDLAPAPEATDESAMADENAPAPTEPDLPDTAAADAPTGRLPQIIAPAPPEPNDSAEAQPGAEVETAPPAETANKPRFLTPGTRRATGDGPVIIDVAPQAPIGAASGPKIGFQKVPGVQINRLPSIEGSAPQPAPDASVPAESEAPQTDRAVDRYAATFDNPGGKPVIAVILIDDGAADGSDPDSVAAIGAPVTVAIDPEGAGAAARAQTYRLSGDEIAILAPALPAGATPSDVEIGYQGIVQALPESVALVAGPESALQGDRRLAQHIASLLGAEGRALVTYAKGLNPARQAAERAGVPYVGITRSLDEAGQDDVAMQRLLDRAAFEAARTGNVLVIGHATPATVSALTGWIASGRKEAVIGPLSAVIAR